MDSTGNNTFTCTTGNHEIPFQTIVGDEKQDEFHPRVKFKAWDNEANFSIGLKHQGGTHSCENGNVTYTADDNLTANFYGLSADKKDFDTSAIRYIPNKSLTPWQIGARYELSRNIHQPMQTIDVHTVDRASMMYYGGYHRDVYIDPAKMDLAECRLAVHGPTNNPMYMDAGLPLIDLQYDESRDDLDKIHKSMVQAVKDIVAKYGVDVIDKGTKLYFADKSRDVKFFSTAFIDGHYYFYVNLGCDYNKAYDYYRENVAKDIRDEYAYGLRAVNANIPESLVDDIIKRYSELYGLPLEMTGYATNEQSLLENLDPIHHKLPWINVAQRTDVYSIKKDEQPTDGFEFSMTLAAKPESNIIELSIQTKGLVFYKQDELKQAESLSSSRPANVIGSYAVYHESKKHNEYKTGKAFHMYRPWAQDATGQRVWCDLDIRTDSLGNALGEEVTITVPQSFLDTAQYPVLIDPTFGYTSAGASALNLANSTTDIFAVLSSQNIPGSGTVSSISAYISITHFSSTSHNAKAAIYDASNNLLITSAENSWTGNLGASWQTFTASGSVTNSNYQLAIAGINIGPSVAYDVIKLYCDSVASAGQNKTAAYSSFPPSALTAMSIDNNSYSIYTTLSSYTPTNTAIDLEQDVSNSQGVKIWGG